MEKALIYFFMGISLSMDTFSLSLSLGTTNPNKNRIRIMTLIVGIFHFIMPLLGYLIGSIIKKHILLIHSNYLSSLIFFLLAIQMLGNKKEEEEQKLTISSILIMSLTVSIDSLSVGFVYNLTNELILEAASLFMIISSIFTWIGLMIGKKIQENFPKIANVIGIIIMLGMSLRYLFFT